MGRAGASPARTLRPLCNRKAILESCILYTGLCESLAEKGWAGGKGVTQTLYSGLFQTTCSGLETGHAT
jgi:hypothetical protein